MSENTIRFDRWIRGNFALLNTELEEMYFSQSHDRMQVEGTGCALKKQLVHEAAPHLARLLDEGNTNEDMESQYDLLGNTGFYIAACHRHGIEGTCPELSPLKSATALALQIGASLGVMPRFAAAHLTTHNKAINGIEKSFTHLHDEKIFNQYNTRSMHAYQCVASHLCKINFIGITSTLALDLLKSANAALEQVLDYNQQLYEQLDTDRFFYNVRPYFKTHKVGLHLCRGANAGDFAGINVIDMLLGLCSANNAYYSQLLVDKMLYIAPDEQGLLRDSMRRGNFMDQLLVAIQNNGPEKMNSLLQQVINAFLKVCKTHGETAKQHHDMLVNKFIIRPSQGLSKEHLDTLTASGPPLPVLLRSLEKLRDLRMAADREDIPTRFRDIQKLQKFADSGT